MIDTFSHCPTNSAASQEEASRLRQLIMGFRITQLIYVAAKLDLADYLAKRKQTAPELASIVDVEPGALYRLLRALASVGIFAEMDGRFEMTPLAKLLLKDSPGSLRSTALIYGDDLIWKAYGLLWQAIETGMPAFDQAWGRPFYEYLNQNPAAASLFHEAMTGFSEQEAAAILTAYDFTKVRLIVDVGGGQGALMGVLLRAHTNLSALIFDRSPPSDGAVRLFAESGLAGRAGFVQGDFFAEVPAGGDLYVLKSIIHNWNNCLAEKILGKCRDAMLEHGRLLIVERVVPPGNSPSEAKLFDINMLVTLGGQERTAAEYETLLNNAGLILTRIVPTSSHMSLIEAVRRS